MVGIAVLGDRRRNRFKEGAAAEPDQAWNRMVTTGTMENPDVRQSFTSKLLDYYTLTKPEVNLLILMTTSAGYYLGSGAAFRLLGLFHTLVGTLLVASGTATLNQYMERAHDAQMRRTANRPLVSGRLSPAEALYFGLALSVAGGIYLVLTVNWLASALAISTLLSYLLIYTPLKRRTPLCTLLGAIPGAMPTLIGWAGASGGLSRQAGFLFAVLFLWQFPHFLAIALMYREDYAHAGFKMLPNFDADGRFTRAEIIGFTVALVITTMLPLATRGFTALYLLPVAGAGLFFLYYGAKLSRSASRGAASRLLHVSVIYLPVVLGMMMVCKPA
jgi:protoheme IX farnesyltransferase